MDKAMLLRVFGAVRHRQLDCAWLEASDGNAERLHNALPRKARPHPIREVRIL
jgi:hypothetical protein